MEELKSCPRCGGKLSEQRIYHYAGGPIRELAGYDGKQYRHCYSCHVDCFEEERGGDRKDDSKAETK